MRQGRFFFMFILLLIAQVCICNFFRLSQYVMLSILPAMILMIPIRRDTISALLIAFASGFAVDFFSDGLMGLNILALVPVAFARFTIIRLVFGEEVFARKEDISVARQGVFKMGLALIMAQTLFLLLYIWADGAGTRPLWFSCTRFAASLVAGVALSMFVARILEIERQS